MISVMSYWLFVTFSSINLSMEHIEISHSTNKTPQLPLEPDFISWIIFLHERYRCGARIIEHPLAEWSVGWPISALTDDLTPQKIETKKRCL